jgi:hypothetical protein
MASQFELEQQRYVEGVRNNASKVSPEFRTVRFLLDNQAVKEDSNRGTNSNIFYGNFKSFWVVKTNLDSFDVKMYVNFQGDVGNPLPLKPNMSISFDYPVNGCALEWPAQAGGYVDIIFSLNTNITPGLIQLSSPPTKGAGLVAEYLYDISSAPNLVAPANSTRSSCYIKNQSAVTLYFGTYASLNGTDYLVKSIDLASGQSMTWTNQQALYMRSASTTATKVCYILDEYN